MSSAHVERGLAGLEVAITGRLASMTHDDAKQRIANAGGRFAPAPGEATTLLVVGQGGPPLGEDGRLTKSLLRAKELQESGAGVRITSEDELLTLLGLEDPNEELARLYTTAQLSRILDVPAAQIRAWVRHELIRPVKILQRLAFFDFHQVATARMLSQLTKSGVTPQRIRASLEQLAGWLPEAERSLAQLETLEQSRLLVVRTSEGDFAEPSGQLRLDFRARQREAPGQVLKPGAPSLEEWLELGLRAEEEERYADAVQAYEGAIDTGGPQPEALLNLGNALYQLGEKTDAARRFQEAAELDPDFVEAWNNLGNALADVERIEGALDAFRQALALQPDYADAHLNLAETLANLGDYDEARVHWKAYLERDPGSSWADVVRERLRRTEE